MRFGTVTILGRTNVGKSTFLNAALGEALAITSPRPQTTRDALLGIVHRRDAQIAFVDTPGLHRPRTELGRRMNATAVDTARSSDVVLFMTDARGLAKRLKLRSLPAGAKDRVDTLLPPDDVRLLDIVPKETPLLVVINKVDLIRDKALLLPLIEEVSARREAAVLPVSVLSRQGVDEVLTQLVELLPEAEARYDEDALTDRPTTFFAREYVREQVMRVTDREVPHSVAVTLDEYDTSGRVPRISATIHVEKAGQRAILVGSRGARIKEIGTAARARIESLLGHQIHLKLFVRVTERWKDVPRQLAELGYDATRGLDLSSALPREGFKPKKDRRRAPRAQGDATATDTARRARTAAPPISSERRTMPRGAGRASANRASASRRTPGPSSDAGRKPSGHSRGPRGKKTQRSKNRGRR